MSERSIPEWYTSMKEAPRISGGFTKNQADRIKELARQRVTGGTRHRTPAMIGMMAVAMAAVLLIVLWRMPDSNLLLRRIVPDPAWVTHNAAWSEGKKIIEAYPGGDFAAGRPAGCWWNLYMPFQTVKDSAIRIEAVHKESGLKMTELAPTLLSAKGNAYNDFTRISSSFDLPAGGHWRFDVYLDDRKLGDAVFEVPEGTWELSPLFPSGSFQLRGVQGKLGFIDPGFVAGKGNKYLWHFWGGKEELQGELRIIALKKGTDKWVNVFEAGGIGISKLNGADGGIPSSMNLPERGIWRLAVLLGERYFGSVTVEVK